MKQSPCRSRSPCRALLRSAGPGLICSAPVRLNPANARAVCAAATPAERRAGRWPELGSGRDRAGHRHHQRACPGLPPHPDPVDARVPPTARSGGLGGRPVTGPTPSRVPKARAQPGPAAALWLRAAARLCGAGGPIGLAVAGGFARGRQGVICPRSLTARAAAPVAAARPDRARLASGGDRVAVRWRGHPSTVTWRGV